MTEACSDAWLLDQCITWKHISSCTFYPKLDIKPRQILI